MFSTTYIVCEVLRTYVTQYKKYVPYMYACAELL